MKIAVVIPIKSSSERIPNKNFKVIAGNPLYHYIISEVLKCPSINSIYIDSDDSQFLTKISELYGCRTILRDSQYASNKTDGHALLAQVADKIEEDIIVQTFVTAPLLKAETIERAIEQFLNGAVKSLIGVIKKKSYTWTLGDEGVPRPCYGSSRIPNSIDLKSDIHESMSLYINYRHEVVRSRKRFQIESVKLFEIPESEALDINYTSDIDTLETYLMGRRLMSSIKLRHIASSLSTPLICDSLDDLGISYKIHNGFKRYRGKGLGISVVKTMKIVSKNTENEGDVYKCLDSYNYLGIGDILLVETAYPDLAYFGDLNSSLLLKTGADGIMIDGMSRDVDSLVHGINVFAKGVTAKDVKFEGMFGGMNKQINFDGENVSPYSIAFYDDASILFIQRADLDRVLKHALEKSSVESSLRSALLDYKKSISAILSEYGNF